MDYSLYVYGEKREKNNMNSKFSGEGKGGQSVRNIKQPEQDVPVHRSIPIWTYARFSIAGGIFWII